MKILADQALKAPKFFIWLPVCIMFVILSLVAIPTLTGALTNVLSPLTIDTDPESMLLYDNPVRVTHREKKETFAIYDLMVVGITNNTHENGVFNKNTLGNIYELVNYAKQLQWENEEGVTEGVVAVELISPSTVDNIAQGGPGTVTFNWLMPRAPETDSQALEVREKANSQPILRGSLTSTDGRSLALYIPLTSKDVSYKISRLLKEKYASFDSDDSFFITGMATAQDTFGVEMFTQMAITTPLAMMLMFGLLWFFFRSIRLVFAPMIIAMLASPRFLVHSSG